MCESCHARGLDRREFLAAATALSAGGLLVAAPDAPATRPAIPAAPRTKRPARIMAAFLFPPADVVNEGRNEDSWSAHNWFTWPGNQFEPERQQANFSERIAEMAAMLGIELDIQPGPIYREAQVREFIARSKAARPDAVLIVNFWNTFSKWSHQMAVESGAPTAIVYHSLGSNHQLPPEYLRHAEGLFYIHSIENWDEIERGLRAVRAKVMLSQSRLLRVSSKTPGAPGRVKDLDVEVAEAPAEEFNGLFDESRPDDAMRRQAMRFKSGAAKVIDVTDEYFIEAMRAHAAVEQIMARYQADAITIECLQLKHRKPCVSFAINNAGLVPCGCENDLNASLTLMLGRWLLDRPGFQHNPEYDTSENLYFGAHCTCPLHLRGPDGDAAKYMVRPFFHQLPRTAALDVQWTPHEPVLLTKYAGGESALHCWTGKVIQSPGSPPAGGCATRVLVHLDRLEDVCKAYAGPHPILFCGGRGDARRFKTFARMYRLKFETNL